MITVEGLTVGYRGAPVLRDLSVSFGPGITTIVGPNGCGKSTLLRTCAGLLKPSAGRVLVEGNDVAALSPRDLARRLAMLPQSPTAPEGLQVSELISRGRHPHQRWFQQWSAADEAVVAEAVAQVGLQDYAEREVNTLSGGQRQRAWIGMVLAQQTRVLLLDEPTTFLDLAHSLDVLQLVRDLQQRTGACVVTVQHDLNLASRFSDRLIVMRDGQILAAGQAQDVLTEPLLYTAFGLAARVWPDPMTGDPVILPG